MLYYYLGIPGSGKSYAGVELIYNNFSDDKEAKKDKKFDWINCYTNINEFQFDKINNVYEFKFDDFYKQLEELYSIYNDKSKTDKDLIEKAIEFKIYKTLFVIDECHRYFDVQDKVLVWWLTYHRHLYHDLILITQSLGLIHAKYKPLAEAFFRAKPSSLTLNKKYFNYTYFTDSRLTQAGKVSVIKIKKNKKVFELYHSGDSVKSKNVIMRFLIIALLFAFVLFAIGYFYFYKKDKDIQELKQKENKFLSKHAAVVPATVSYSSVNRSKNTDDFDYADIDIKFHKQTKGRTRIA